MAALIWGVVALIVAVVALRRKTQRRRGGVGTAAVGTMYDWLNQEKQNAVEIILEERAGARDPEHANGIVPGESQTTNPSESRIPNPKSHP